MQLNPRQLRGFTLLEVMIAAMLLVVALVGSISLIFGLLRGNQNTRSRDSATFMAQQLLDQYDSIPLSTLALATYAFSTPGPTPTVPVCYRDGDSAFLDHPIDCVGAPAAFAVREQYCCVGPNVGPNVLQVGNGCGTMAPLPFNVNTYAVTVAGTPRSNGLTCEIQVEITWPVEPTGATAANLFLTTSNATTPALGFQNHVVLTTVRAQ